MQFITLFLLALFTTTLLAKEPIVIAHRGASGYLPDHTLAAKALAYGQGADFLEQDLVMTKDDHLVVFHDLYLDNTTNVAEIYPNKKRKDGKYYVIDFTLAELRTLSISSPFKTKDNKVSARYPKRFPIFKSKFAIHTFEEEIEFIQGLNKASNKSVGIYPEIKAPWFHSQHKKDIAVSALKVLKKYGYHQTPQQVYLQSFDPVALKRIKHDLFKQMDIYIPLVQLVADTSWHETMVLVDYHWENFNYNHMMSNNGIKEVASYADGLGFWLGNALPENTENKDIGALANKVAFIHQQGLKVHPYTFRQDDLPGYVNSYEQLVDLYINQVKIDGLFTDFTDVTKAIIQTKYK